jgi:hypothetical protein
MDVNEELSGILSDELVLRIMRDAEAIGITLSEWVRRVAEAELQRGVRTACRTADSGTVTKGK